MKLLQLQKPTLWMYLNTKHKKLFSNFTIFLFIMSIKENINQIRKQIPANVKLIGVSKFHTPETIMEAYNLGERHFGESRVQEFVDKAPLLPDDIQWHFIGHLQRNKIKFLVDKVSLIHGVDSLRLLNAINTQAQKTNQTVSILLQVHIADEETKFGFSKEEIEDLFSNNHFESLKNIKVAGLMGMATNTDNEEQIRSEFRGLKQLFDKIKSNYSDEYFIELSMGMSDDYKIAIEEGSTMVRIGTAIFGEREY